MVRRASLAPSDWEVRILDHHEGFIDWDTYLANQARINANIRPVAHPAGDGAVREGSALLQGLATCGTCGRKLAVYYDGERKATPGYYCTGTGELVDGRGVRHLRVGGVGIDAAVTALFLTALAPAGRKPASAARGVEDGADAALEQWRREAEPARYAAQGRTPLPGGRPGEPARRPWTGNRVGNRAAAPSPTPKPNWRTAKPNDRKPLPHKRNRRSWPSATTSRRCGKRPPPPTATANSSCAPCSTR